MKATVYVCDTCSSTYLHPLGSEHVRQTGAGGKCANTLRPVELSDDTPASRRRMMVTAENSQDVVAFLGGDAEVMDPTGMVMSIERSLRVLTGDMLVRVGDDVQVWRRVP